MAPLGEDNMRVSIDVVKVIEVFSSTYLEENSTVQETVGYHVA